MPYEGGNDRESTPSAGEIIGVDVAVDRCDASMGVEGVGEILHQAEFARATWLRDDGNWGGLEWADEVFDFVPGERAKVAPFVQFCLDDVIESSGVFCCGYIIWGGMGGGYCGDACTEAEIKTSRDGRVQCDEPGLCKEVLPGLRVVWGGYAMPLVLEGISEHHAPCRRSLSIRGEWGGRGCCNHEAGSSCCREFGCAG